MTLPLAAAAPQRPPQRLSPPSRPFRRWRTPRGLRRTETPRYGRRDARSALVSPSRSKWGDRRGQRIRAAQKCTRSEEHTSELQSLAYLVCRLLLEKKKQK